MRLTLLLILAVAALLARQPFVEKIDLFEAGKDGYATYRIPGIVVTRKGTVLAYTEARQSARGDWGPIDIFLRRSTDGGQSFQARQRIASVAGPHRKNPVALAQNLANPDDRTYNNPVAIADRNGAVHFLFCLEYMRAFYMRSDDDGRTFSKPVEITAAFEQFRKDYDWKVLATGPGHSIQLRNGRLIVPVWLSLGTGSHAHRPSVNSVIYSDDHGATWHRGDIAVPDTQEFVFPNETVAAQLPDGRVMLNVRSESKARRRILTYSKDGATGWSAPVFHPQLLEPICMASMISVGRLLVFSNPDMPTSERRNVTIKLSYDEGKTWPVSRALEQGPSGYSDLAAAGDGIILCLYERANRFLTLARFNQEWVKEE